MGIKEEYLFRIKQHLERIEKSDLESDLIIGIERIHKESFDTMRRLYNYKVEEMRLNEIFSKESNVKTLEISDDLFEKLENLTKYYGTSIEKVILDHIGQSWYELNNLVQKEKLNEKDMS